MSDPIRRADFGRVSVFFGEESRARGDEPCETWPLARLDELAALADALVLALPLAEETRHLSTRAASRS